jgi:hypothetical protein
MTAVSRVDALSGIVEWMGAYEGRDGTTLSALVEEGATDEEILEEEQIPAEILAGFRLAVRELETEERRLRELAVVRAVRAERPDLDPHEIRRVVRARRAAR